MSKETFMSPLASQVQRFLQFKRAAGCRYEEGERQLRIMDRVRHHTLSRTTPSLLTPLSGPT